MNGATTIPTSPTVGLLQAEALRVRWTFTQAIPLIVVVFGLSAIRISHVPSLSASEDWNGGVLAWLSMFPFTFSLPVAALAGALADDRDIRWRGGGTWWRSTSARKVSAVRTVVESFWILVSLLLLSAVILGDAALRGSFPVPWGRVIGLMVLLWISMTGATAVGRSLYRITGAAALGIAPVLAMVSSIAGAVRAEELTWWAEPWAWMPHAALPLVGTHGNSVPLDADSPVWGWSPVPGLTLSAAFAVVAVTAAVLLKPRSARGSRGSLGSRHHPHTVSHRGRSTAAPVEKLPTGPRASVLGAASRILPWRIWWILAVTLWVILTLTRLIFPDSYAPRLYTLIAVPTTAAVVGVMMWTCAAPGWRGVVTRRSGVRLPAATAVWAGLFTVSVLAVSAVVVFVGNSSHLGMPGPDSPEADFRGVYAIAVMPVVAFLVAGVSYALAALGTTAAAIVVNVAAATWSLLVSGDTLSDSALWFSAFWGWADIAATHVDRWFLIWMLSAVIGAVSITLVRVRARRLGK